ncbi:MAG: putative toxin-antitoxin system toxin component, PIN family [Promethearchaeota archaeon]|nr:MAG: putative toxin-antitoxin system toxin component, PIN family [Candidatus Lokiarchaeota archaeon]
MRLIIDANILFSALIKDSLTAKIIVDERLKLYAPEFLFEEVAKYEDYLLKKTKRTRNDFKSFYILLKQKISIIPKEEINPYIKKAMDFSPDPKDTVYLALSLAINCAFWSNDKELKEKQDLVKILTTEEILNKFGILNNGKIKQN